MHYSSSVDPRHLRRFLQRLIACKISRFLILIVTHFAFAVTTCALGRVLVKKYARANVSPFNPYRRPITIFTYPYYVTYTFPTIDPLLLTDLLKNV